MTRTIEEAGVVFPVLVFTSDVVEFAKDRTILSRGRHRGAKVGDCYPVQGISFIDQSGRLFAVRRAHVTAILGSLVDKPLSRLLTKIGLLAPILEEDVEIEEIESLTLDRAKAITLPLFKATEEVLHGNCYCRALAATTMADLISAAQ